MGNDVNRELIYLWRALKDGWTPPDKITRAEYEDIKAHRDDYPAPLVAFAGFCCSFPLVFGGAYRVEGATNFALRGKNVLTAQIQKMRDVEFTVGDYQDLQYPERSIIYCDPPYQDSIAKNNDKRVYYGGQFDHDAFWAWAAEMSEQGHDVYVSETRAPAEFEAICEIELKNMTGLGKLKNLTRFERLFRYRKSLQKSMT